MDSDLDEKHKILQEIWLKREHLAHYQKRSAELGEDMEETEEQFHNLKQEKFIDDNELSRLKNDEALINIEIEEIEEADETVLEQTLNDSLANFSVTGTEDDAEYLASEITELTKKANVLGAKVRTLHNDELLVKQRVDEITETITEIAQVIEHYSKDITAGEATITHLQRDKQHLISQIDELRVKLNEKEMNRTPPRGAERGNSGLVEYDDYMKKLRMNLIPAREQKRNIELQHMEVSQRLDALRRRREIDEKGRVTDATVALMCEVYNQSSFIDNLKVCLSVFCDDHQEWAGGVAARFEQSNAAVLPLLKSETLEHIRNFRNLLEQLRNSICTLLDKLKPAYEAELQQFNEAQQRFQQKVSFTPVGRNQEANKFFDFLQTLHSCLNNP